MSPHRVASVATLMLALVLTPAIAGAQVPATPHLVANLTGAQQVPPNGSAGTGTARIALFPTSIFGTLSFVGLGSNQIEIHIHGPAGVTDPGPILFTSPGTGTTAGGATIGPFTVTPAQLAELRAGYWYIDVHTVGFPGGEIRGQFRHEPTFLAALTPSQIVPPVVSSAFGHFTGQLTANQGLLMFTTGYVSIPGGISAMHLHGPALPGQAGPELLVVSGANPTGSITFLNRSIGMTPARLAELKAGQWYVDVHTAAAPAGLLRGQIKLANLTTDFDGDGRSELGTLRGPAAVDWYLLNHASGAFSGQTFGVGTDRPAPADFDADGRTDLSVFRPGAAGTFYVMRSAAGFQAQPWGTTGDDPRIVADFDGDGVPDFAVYRLGVAGAFFILQSTDGAFRGVPFGGVSDASISGDYDGDRRADVSIYRISTNTYFILRSALGLLVQPWGLFATDLLTPGDYDGDGKTDVAVFRFTGAGAGTWYILQSSTGLMRAEAFGATGDEPAPADFDADGKTDLAVARNTPFGKIWYILQSSTGTLAAAPFGLSTDSLVHRYLIR